MRIAVVGAGISGLSAAYFLSPRHEVLLFEKEPRAGGHAWTLTVPSPAGPLPVDVGFLVYNEATYPIFSQMLRDLEVPTQPSDMSFSVQCRACGLEYASHGWSSLIGGARGWWRPRYPWMLFEIVRFYRLGRKWLATPDDAKTLGEFLSRQGFSREFLRHFIGPMTAAIWSARSDRVTDFPLALFLRFFANHGLLSLSGQPRWRTIRGGSREYVDRILARLGPQVHLGSPVTRIVRTGRGVRLTVAGVGEINAEAVVLATHADQALALLADASPAERAALRALPYQRNSALLHTDPSLMPSRRRLWASWNYHTTVCSQQSRPVGITYWLNRLQSLPAPPQWFVTLNPEREVAPEQVVQRLEFEHPVYLPDSPLAQEQLRNLSGQRRVFFAGAYLGYGFHEDGARAGHEVAAQVERWALAA